MTPKRIIVTGGFGFIGAAMVRRLVADGHEVFVFVKKDSRDDRVRDILPKITVYHEDLENLESLQARVGEIKPDGFFHFAASNIQSGVTAEDEEVVRTNILGTHNLLTAAAQAPYEFFINIGSFLEYGMQDHALCESDILAPPNLYAVSKLSATLLAQAAGKSGKPVVTLRLMTPYGPGIQQGRVMYEVVARALSGETIKLTRPTVGRDFLYIDDIIDLCLEAAEKADTQKGEIFNMGSGVQTNLGPLVEMVLAKTGSKAQVEWGGFKQVAYDSDVWVADMSKTFAAFAWRPKVPLEAGVEKMIEWVKSIKK